MRTGFLSLTFSIFLAIPSGGFAQSSIQTLFGGPPDGLPALTATLAAPSAVAVDAQGLIYVGLKNTHRVIRFGSDRIVTTVAGTGVTGNSGDGGPARLATLGTPSGMTFDQAGNLYIADSLSNVIRRVSTDGIITTFAGTGKSAYSGDGGPAAAAALKQPSALVFDANGNLLVADTGNHTIRRISPDGTITRFAGVGNQAAGGDDGPALEAGLYSPLGLAIDGTGIVYIADTGNNKIRTVDSTGTITLYAGNKGGFSGSGNSEGIDVTKVLLYYPTTLIFDSAGQLFYNDQYEYKIKRIQPDGRVYSVAGTGVKGAEGDGGIARSANINPQSIALDAKGNVLIADGDNNRVRIVTAGDGLIDTIAGNGVSAYDPRYMLRNGDSLYFSDGNGQRVRLFQLSTGAISLVAGIGSAGYAGDGDSAFTAYIRNPRGIALDSAGNLYIADSGNQRIRKVGTDGNISTIAGTGTATTTGDGAVATAATLNEPVDVAVDSSGVIYIAERSGHCVRRITKDGFISTIAGNGTGGPPDSETGIGVQQSLYLPQAILIEKQGSILISDSGNNRVRRLTSDGAITTIAGNGTATYSGDGGPATSASLRTPIGLAVDDAGNIYISDSDNHAVRQIAGDGTITTVAGLASPQGNNRTGGFNGDGSPATSLSLNRPTGLTASAASCSILIADTSNQRVRQLNAGVAVTIATNPPGLMVIIDGQNPVSTPLTTSFAPGTQHTVDTPAAQDNGSGTRYLSTGGPVSAGGTCASPHQSVTLNLRTQYALSIMPDNGGSITAPDQSAIAGWQDAGAQVTLTAVPADNFVFTGWDGDCAGSGTATSCPLTMDQPKNAIAHFQPKP